MCVYLAEDEEEGADGGVADGQGAAVDAPVQHGQDVVDEGVGGEQPGQEAEGAQQLAVEAVLAREAGRLLQLQQPLEHELAARHLLAVGEDARLVGPREQREEGLQVVDGGAEDLSGGVARGKLLVLVWLHRYRYGKHTLKKIKASYAHF